jgi:hypothetical protein
MWKRSLYLVAFLAIVLTVSACGGGPGSTQARLTEESSLSKGQRASIVGGDLEIRFQKVMEDSRCPSGVTCVWAGRVTCMVELKSAGSSYHMALTEPGLTSEYSKETYEGYELAFHVTPYPEAGEKIPTDAYRLHLIVSRLPQLTETLGSVIAEPLSFKGQDITVVGYYRGWDLLHETNTAPPVSRSDWVIKDLTGAIYVSANSEAEVPEGLNPSSLENISAILRVKGGVRVTEAGQPYIEATSIEQISYTNGVTVE